MLEEMSCTLQRQKDRIAELISNIETYKSENEQLTENSIELQMQIQRATTSRDSYASQLEGVTKEYEGVTCVMWCVMYVCLMYVRVYICITYVYVRMYVLWMMSICVCIYNMCTICAFKSLLLVVSRS